MRNALFIIFFEFMTGTPPSVFSRGPARANRGFALLEICFAVIFAALMGAVLIRSLLQSERYAASSRLLTNARVIIHRNINASTGIVFTGTSSTPDLLAVTSGSGVICDDDGSGSVTSPLENIQVLRSGTNVAVSGTLRRIVTAEPVIVSGTSADSSVVVRRVTFQIDYDYRSHHYTYSESTLRSSDSQ
jgi:hypothetical protein